MSKSELKRLCTQDPVAMAEQIAELTEKLAAAEAINENLLGENTYFCMEIQRYGLLDIRRDRREAYETRQRELLAKERQAGRDEMLKEISDALQSDLEHGVKWLNEEAAEEFERKYPALNRVLRDSNQRSNDA